ncbi:MAG: outer membrane protein assembly factor BamA [Deltaproteobacteria bacterium]|nr:outer membrane protein assembly factor BamA [Deltaproteobacteria bacterium]
MKIMGFSLRKRFIFFIFLLAFSLQPLAFGMSMAQDVNVVILPFEVHARDNISDFRLKILEAIASSLDETKGIRVIAGDRLKDVIMEKGTKIFDEGAAGAVGKELGANYVVLGSISKLGKRYSIDAKVYNVGQDKLSSLSYIEGEDTKEITQRVYDLSSAISREILKEAITAEKADAESGIIGKIKITGNKRMDTDAIRAKIKTRAGDKFDSDQIKEDIRAIYDSGFFDDIIADMADTAVGKELTFIVKEKPIIKQVIFAGNKELTEEKIRESLTIKTGSILNRIVLQENADKLKTLYANEGFYLAKIEPVVSIANEIEASVNFQIDEGKKVKVKNITIIGNQKMTEKKIRKVMNTKEAGFFSFITKSGVYQEFIFQNDLNLIAGLYYDNGYIQANITDSKVTLSSDKEWLYITIAVSEGEQFKVGKVDVRGDILTTKRAILEKIKNKTGNIFSRKIVGGDITKITDIYGNDGYANVDVNPVTKLNTEAKTVDLVFDINKGEPVYIEKVNIRGNVTTRDKVIRREVELGEGELYSSTGIKRSRSNLRRLGYFDDVNIATGPGSSENKMTVDVEVKERPTGFIAAGAGYSSADGMIVTANITQKNLLGTGKQLDLSALLSSKTSRFNLGFTEPWFLDKPISAGIDIFNTTKEYTDFTRDSVGFGLRFGFPLYRRDTRGYLTYKLEEVEVTRVASGASQIIRDQEGKNLISSINAAIRKDTRDDALFPTEGSVIYFSIEFGGGPIGGDVNYVKYLLEGTRYFSMPYDTVLAARALAGYLHGFDGKDAPVYERFYLGGINSIRGFKTRGISPKDPTTNELIGGDGEALLNIEYIFPIFTEQKFKGVVFFDTGNTWDGGFLNGLRYSAGLGIRWVSPLGPIRLEWGYNLDKKEGEDSSQWDFTIGTSF